MSRPKHSREPAFQITWCLLHLAAGVMHLASAVYHIRRARRDEAAAKSP